MQHDLFGSTSSIRTARETIRRLFEEGQLDENAATAYLLALDTAARRASGTRPADRHRPTSLQLFVGARTNAHVLRSVA
jgi:hypothetical protein